MVGDAQGNGQIVFLGQSLQCPALCMALSQLVLCLYPFSGEFRSCNGEVVTLQWHEITAAVLYCGIMPRSSPRSHGFLWPSHSTAELSIGPGRFLHLACVCGATVCLSCEALRPNLRMSFVKACICLHDPVLPGGRCLPDVACIDNYQPVKCGVASLHSCILQAN